MIWLLTYDDESLALAEAVEKYHVGVPPVQWLPWIPQLLTCLVRNEGKLILNLLSTVGRMFPQAVYFPIRSVIDSFCRYSGVQKTTYSGIWIAQNLRIIEWSVIKIMLNFASGPAS